MKGGFGDVRFCAVPLSDVVGTSILLPRPYRSQRHGQKLIHGMSVKKVNLASLV